jgi:hypothetical protein
VATDRARRAPSTRMEVPTMETPASPRMPAPTSRVETAQVAAIEPADVAADIASGIGRLPSWVIVAAVAAAAVALWLVAFDNGQASAMADSTGTALHELFHDGRHLMGAPCH